MNNTIKTCDVKCKESSEKNVWKYIFQNDKIIMEAVLYRYESFENRTVICCSVQSGCPVGCAFCGTGKKFIRNLTSDEITDQIKYIIKDKNITPDNVEKFQIMFMSMGEPFLNMDNVISAITLLNMLYSDADLLVSTVGIDDTAAWEKFIMISSKIDRVGLQFSLHRCYDIQRKELIPYELCMDIKTLRDFGYIWHMATSRPVYLNYCVTTENTSDVELDRITDLFSRLIFNLTFSVICQPDETRASAEFHNLDLLTECCEKFLMDGYNVRQFNPAGQDDISGGCGQLHSVQRWFREHKY